MSNDQLTLLNHALSALEAQKSSPTRNFIPCETACVTKRLGISGSVLSRAKRQGKLPYRISFEGKTAVIEFAYQHKRKDYWIFYTEQ